MSLVLRHRQTIALCHGCFDILHIGHFRHLREAKGMAELLYVSITASGWVTKFKGDGHPALGDEERAVQLRGVRWVDDVFICDAPNGAPAIREVRPTYYVKGIDYSLRGICEEERKACLEVGARVVFTTSAKRSVAEIAAKFSKEVR